MLVRGTLPRNRLWSGEEAGAPGGIRTPDLLIRSPMPANGPSLPYLVLSRAARTTRFWVGSRVSMVLASRRSLMPTPAATSVRCPRHRRESDARRPRASAGTVYRDWEWVHG